MLESLNNSVSIPLWTLPALAMVGVVVGMLGLSLSIIMLGKERQSEKKVVKNKKVTKSAKEEIRPIPDLEVERKPGGSLVTITRRK